MRMILNRLHMENFKGVRDMTIDFSEQRTTVRGMNGTGKTTIVDAFCWALWNQDSHGNAPGSDNFREKPLDENGDVIHNLDTTVELFCALDGQRFDVKRTQTENWVKKRGNRDATFQGNVSTYWINGVETKQADFKARIKAIADEDIFRLVGSLSAFNSMEWKKRRAALLALAGDDVDGELLARDEYRPLADEIAARNVSPDDLRKVLADSRKAIGNELKMLPIRIDEAQKSMPDLKPEQVRDAEYLVESTKHDIEGVEEQIMTAKAQAGQGGRRGQILALEAELVSMKRRVLDDFMAAKRKLQADMDDASDSFRRASAQLSNARASRQRLADRLDKESTVLAELRKKYMDVKRMPVTVSNTCPTCGQALPADRVEETRRAAEQEKRQHLDDIGRQGKAGAELVESIKADIADVEQTIADCENRQRAAETAREAAAQALKDFPAEPDWSAESRISDAESELEALRAEQTENPDEKVRQLTDRKREMLALIDRQNAILARRDVAVEARQRIKAYEARQQELGAQLGEVEMLIDLLERFIQDRCGALEDSINSHFPTVRWKLFDRQINGGLVDTCVAMLECDGAYVPYESANTARQIAADVEIIDVLSARYDVRVPLFVDNAERVNVLPEIESQTITLAVSTDGELNVKEA